MKTRLMLKILRSDESTARKKKQKEYGKQKQNKKSSEIYKKLKATHYP